MAVVQVSTSQHNTVGKLSRLTATSRFDWLIALLSTWFVLGVYLDGWVHSHYPDSIESFLTPWHAVLYTGMLSVFIVLAVVQMRNLSKGYGLTNALPIGYGLSFIGAGLFVLGGVFDFGWHSLFGTEADIEALLSPAHLWLATAGFLVVTGPLRSAWNRRTSSDGWRTLFPALISLALALSVLTFFTEYAHFFNVPSILVIHPGNNPSIHELADPTFLPNVYGVVLALLPTALVMGCILFALRRWSLPIGSISFILGINSLLMFWLSWGEVSKYPLLLIGVIAAGIIGDLMLWRLKPSITRKPMLRVFAFSLPFALFLLFLLLLNATAISQTGSGLWWKIHMWLGVPFFAGIASLLLSYLVVPPADPLDASPLPEV